MTPPNDRYAAMIDNVLHKLRSQMLPEEYFGSLHKLNGCLEEGDLRWHWQRCTQGMSSDAIIAIGRRIIKKHEEIFGRYPHVDQYPDEFRSYIDVAQNDDQIRQEIFLMGAGVHGEKIEPRSAVILCIHAAKMAELRTPSFYKSSTACCDAMCKAAVGTVASILPLFASRAASLQHPEFSALELPSQRTFLAALDLLRCLSSCPFPWPEKVLAECADRFGVELHLGMTSFGSASSGFADSMHQIVEYEGIMGHSAVAHSRAITSQVCRFFAASLASMEQSPATVELKALFEETDVNKSGDLGREELSAMLLGKGYAFPPSTIDQLFRELENPETCGISYAALFKYAMSPTGLGGNILKDGGGGGGGGQYEKMQEITELRLLLQQLTRPAGSSTTPLHSCNFAISGMDYCVRVFTSLSTWEFVDRCKKWELSLACLSAFHSALERTVRTKELSGPLVATCPISQVAQFLLHRACADGGQLLTSIVHAASLLGLSAVSDPVVLPLDFGSGSLLSTATELEISIILNLGTVGAKALAVLIEHSVGNKELSRQLGFVLCTASAVVPPGLLNSQRSLEGNYLTVLAGMLAFPPPLTLTAQTSEMQMEVLRLMTKVTQCTEAFRLSQTTCEVTSLLDILGASNVPAFMSSLSSYLKEFLANGGAENAENARVTAVLDLLIIAGTTQPTMFATLIACQAAEDKKGLRSKRRHSTACAKIAWEEMTGSTGSSYDAKLVLEITKHNPEDSEFLRLLLQGVKLTSKLYDNHPQVLHKIFSVVANIWDKSASNVYLAKASLFIALSKEFWTYVAMPLGPKIPEKDILFRNIENYRKEEQVVAQLIRDELQVAGRSGRKTPWILWQEQIKVGVQVYLQIAGVSPDEFLATDFVLFHKRNDFVRSNRVSSQIASIAYAARERGQKLAKECHILLVHAASMDLFTRESRGIFSTCLEVLLQNGHGDEDRLRDIHRDTTRAVKTFESRRDPAKEKEPISKEVYRETCKELVRVLDEMPIKIESETHAFLQNAHSATNSRFKYWLKNYLGAELDEHLMEECSELAADIGINLRHLARNRSLPECEAFFGVDHEYLLAPIQNTTEALLHGIILSADTMPDGYDRIRRPWNVPGVPSLVSDVEKYFSWCALTSKLASLNNMWSVSNAKGYLLRASKRFFSTHIGEKPQPQKRSYLKRIRAGSADASHSGCSGSEEIKSPITPQTPSLAPFNVFSPGGAASGIATPSGLPSLMPGDVRSYALVEELLKDLFDQYNDAAASEDKRRRKSFMQVDFQGPPDAAFKGKGHNALLSIEKYDLLLAMLSLQLQTVVSSTANPFGAVIIERDELRLSEARIEKYLQNLSCIYEAQIEALERSDPEELIATPITFVSHSAEYADKGNDTQVDVKQGRSLTMHNPDIRHAVKLPLLSSMLLLLNRQARDGQQDNPIQNAAPVSQSLSVQSPRAGSGGESRTSDVAYHRLRIFQYALKTLREETQNGWISAFVGVGSSCCASQLPGHRNKVGASSSVSAEHTHELPSTFIRCIDGVCLRPGARRAPLVQVCLRLLKAALPSFTASDVEDDCWVRALDSNSGVLVLILRELCSSKEACEFVKLEHDYGRWMDKTRPGSSSTKLAQTKDEYAQVPTRAFDNKAVPPKRSSEAMSASSLLPAIKPAAAAAATAEAMPYTPHVDPADLLAAHRDLLDVMFAATGLGSNAIICQHLTRGGLIRELIKSTIFRTLQEVLTAQVGAKPAVLMGYSARTGEAAIALECWERVLQILAEIIKKLPVIRLGVRGGYNQAEAEDNIMKDIVNFVSTYAGLLLLPMHMTDCRFSLRQLEITRTTMYFLSELTSHAQWQSACPNIFNNLEERSSFMVKKCSVALNGGADHKDLDSVQHQQHLKAYILAVACEERNLEGPPSSSRIWVKFREDYAHILLQPAFRKAGASADKTPKKTPSPPSATAALKPTNKGLSLTPAGTEKLNFDPSSAVKPKAVEAMPQVSVSASQQQQQQDSADEDENPCHPMAFVLVKMEQALLSALVPIVSFLVHATPDPFGIPAAAGGPVSAGPAPSLGTKLDSYSYAKEKLMEGTTIFYRKALINDDGKEEEHPHLYQGVITGITRIPGNQPYILEVVQAKGKRDSNITSNNVVYLQRPLMNFMSMFEISRDNVGFQHDDDSSSSMVVSYDDGYSAAVGTEQGFIGEAGAMRELATGAGTGHLLVILKYVTNETVNKRLIPEETNGKKGKVHKASGQGHSASNIIMDFYRLFGQLSWLLFANCKHHLLAMQHDVQMREGIVMQLEELKELLRDGETLYGADRGGYLSYWFRMDTIKMFNVRF